MANTTADKLAKLAETKSSIKQAIIDKGVSVSDTDTFASYAGKIGQIQGGGSIPSYVPSKIIDSTGKIVQDPNQTTLSVAPATDVGNYGLTHAFYENDNLTSVDLSSLTTVSGNYAMEGCFQFCTNLASVDVSSLTTISGVSAMDSCFAYSSLTSVVFSSLTTISGTNTLSRCFLACSSLTEISFPALQSFGTDAVNQFYKMLSSVRGCTLHFPSNMQSEVESRSGYPNFGGTNTVVLFDLPPTTAEA